MDLKICLLVVVSAVLLENHLGAAQQSTGAYSFVFEYVWVGGSAASRNGRSPEYQVGLDVGLAVGLGFGVPICFVLFTLFYGLTCQSRIARMDQETPHWQKTSVKDGAKANLGDEPQTFRELELKEQSSTQI